MKENNLLLLDTDSTVDSVADDNDTHKQHQYNSVIRKWKQVNPNRNASVVRRNFLNPNYFFQPYFDGGLHAGLTVKEFVVGQKTELKNGKTVFNKVSKYSGITLAFVQQAIGVTDRLELTVSGHKLGPDYDWWVEEKFKPEVLKPLVAAKKFANLIVSYGGVGAAVGYGPWDVAYKLANKNIDQAVELLMPAFIGYQERITKFAGLDPKTEMPLNLDFDIEGINFDDDHKAGMEILFKTLAKMKKMNSAWNFTITLPVMPSGLLERDHDNVLHTALLIFKEANLTSEQDLFNINIMTMNYSEMIGTDVLNSGDTFFHLAVKAIQNTKAQYHTLLKKLWSLTLTDKKLTNKIIATPMIGINDVNNNYFTLEDAKDLYNWAQIKHLGGIRIWSLNRDDPGSVTEGAGITNHGLKYLNLWDYSRVLSGEWTDWVKNPVCEV